MSDSTHENKITAQEPEVNFWPETEEEDEALWDAQFAASPEFIAKLEQIAIREREAGLMVSLDDEIDRMLAEDDV